MIPKLYASANNGQTLSPLGFLSRCRSCEVTEEINGEYSLSLLTDNAELAAENITSQKIIVVKPNPTDSEQRFKITQTNRRINGEIEVTAEHIRSVLNQFVAEGSSVYKTKEDVKITVSPSGAWNAVIDKITGGVPFSFSSDILTTAAFWLGLVQPEFMGNVLGNNEGGFLNLFGGEYKYNNFDIQLLSQRGSERNVTLRYGQNISEATQTEDCNNLYSHIMPFGTVIGRSGKSDSPVNITAREVAIPNSLCSFKRTFLYDCSDVEEVKTFRVFTHYGTDDEGHQHSPGDYYPEARALMQQVALRYAASNNLGTPSVGIEVTHHSELEKMSEVALGDTVRVILDNFGTTATARVTKATYDVLNERWKSLQVGESKVTLAAVLLNQQKFLKRK